MFFDPSNIEHPFTYKPEANNSAMEEFIKLQQEIIANGQVIDPHTGKPDYSGLLPEYEYLKNK